jgi:amphiphysin
MEDNATTCVADTASPADLEREEGVASPLKTPPPKPAPLDMLPLSDADPPTGESGGKGRNEGNGVQPPGNLLYTVVSTHVYQGEDEDELTFEKGSVIYVVAYEDPDDEEEGWCMGILQKSGERGIFPENFTKRQE